MSKIKLNFAKKIITLSDRTSALKLYSYIRNHWKYSDTAIFNPFPFEATSTSLKTINGWKVYINYSCPIYGNYLEGDIAPMISGLQDCNTKASPLGFKLYYLATKAGYYKTAKRIEKEYGLSND